jgi:DNA-binding CsgD family transcriptional regulator
MSAATLLRQGRGSFVRRAWRDAFDQLSRADRESPLDPTDLEKLAIAAYLTGRDADSAACWARAHHEHVRRGEVERAARCAFWLAFELFNKGESARGSGWVARARRLLDGSPRDCVERGYLRWTAAFQCITEGDWPAAATGFDEAGAIGERFGDPDLVALSRHGRGRALIRVGRYREGVALLDEAMVAVETGELTPLVAGEVYCSVISGCLEIFDLRRAQEWTSALTRWCDSQPDLVPYSGECLVRRVELMLLHGAWPDAGETARRACAWFADRADQPTPGAAFYQLAEVHRLRGALADAEEAYRQASRLGRSPQPGLALLRLAQGEVETAATASRRALDEGNEPRARARLLPAHVEIMLAANDVASARAATDELAEITATFDAPYLHAVTATARGAVLLAEGDARAAVATLREAWALWQTLDAPYEAARVRALIGLCCRTLGDEESAAMELDAARWVLERLGAAQALARLDELSRKPASGASGRLTAREVQVLRLVATGRTNRAVAAELVISEKTVARHLSNIFTKLGIPSRAAATAFAYRHGIV